MLDSSNVDWHNKGPTRRIGPSQVDEQTIIVSKSYLWAVAAL